MSEESKTPDADYVHMAGGAGVTPGGGTIKLPDGLDDPNLSQEDRDHRLAIALQQQETAAVLDSHKKRQENYKEAQKNRTARSGTFSRLAAVRDKDHGMLSVPGDYSTENAYVSGAGSATASGEFAAPIKHTINSGSPQEVADATMAAELQKIEQAGAGTVQTVDKIITSEKDEEEAQLRRTERSHWRH